MWEEESKGEEWVKSTGQVNCESDSEGRDGTRESECESKQKGHYSETHQKGKSGSGKALT